MVDIPANTWMLAGLVFLAVTLGFISLVLLWEWARELAGKRAVRRQLERTLREGMPSEAAQDALFRGMPGADVQWLQVLAAHVPQLRDLERLLYQAGLRWGAHSFLLVAASLALGLTALCRVAGQSWAVAALCGALGLLAPFLYARRRRAARFRAFEEQLPEAVDLLGRAIRAGHPLAAGLKMIGDEAPDPVGSEFRRVFEEQRFGLPTEDALLGRAQRVDLIDVRILVTAILIQREVGGNLAEILDKIAHTVRARFAIRRQLRVYTAQGRFSGYVLAVLPVAVGSLIFLLSPEHMMTLFREPAGRTMLVTAAVMQVVGYFWIRRIVNIEI